LPGLPTSSSAGRQETFIAIAMPITRKHLGAKLGIVAAVATVGFIVFRLTDAAAPVATALELSSESAAPLSVLGLRVEGEDVLPEGWTPGAGSRVPGNAYTPSRSLSLRIGRPSRITATLSVPPSTEASCTPEPRPHGSCVLKVRFMTPTDLRCEFECKTQQP
jgi:hypothetical protein